MVDSVHMLHIFDHMVIRPLIYLMDEETRAMVGGACWVTRLPGGCGLLGHMTSWWAWLVGSHDLVSG